MVVQHHYTGYKSTDNCDNQINCMPGYCIRYLKKILHLYASAQVYEEYNV